MVMLGIKCSRAKDDTGMVRVVRQVALAAERVYVPASVATLLFGLTLAWLGDLWTVLAIMAVVLVAAGALWLPPAIGKTAPAG